MQMTTNAVPFRPDGSERDAQSSAVEVWTPSMLSLPFLRVISDFLLVASGTLIGGSIGHVLQLSQTFKLSLNELFFGSLIYSCIVICFLQSDNAYPRVCSLLHVKETETVLRVSIKAILAGLVLCIVARYPVPRMAMLVAWSVGTISLTVGRVWVQESARKHLAPTIPRRRSLMYGTKRTARRFFTSALHSPMLGIDPVGFVGSMSEPNAEIYSNDYFQRDSRPIFRESLSVELLKRLEIKDVYVCDTSITDFGLKQVREIVQAANCSLSLVDDQEILANSMPTWVWEMDGLFVATAGLNAPGKFYRAMKRLLDIVCAITLMALTAPICALLAILVRWESKGPILFSQTRVGQNGRLFEILKFRSMKVDAPKYARSVGEGMDIWV